MLFANQPNISEIFTPGNFTTNLAIKDLNHSFSTLNLNCTSTSSLVCQ